MRRFPEQADGFRIAGVFFLLVVASGTWAAVAAVLGVFALAVLVITDDKRNRRTREIIREVGRLR